MNNRVTTGFQSALMGDMIAHRQLSVERLKSSFHGEFDAVTQAAFVAFVAALAENDVVDLSVNNRAALRRSVSTMLVAFDSAAGKFTTTILDSLRTYVYDEARFFDSAIRRIVTADDAETAYTEEALWSLTASTLVAASGFTVRQMLASLIQDTRRRLIGAIQSAVSMRFTTQNVLAGLTGTSGALRRDGLFHKLRNLVNVTVDTVFQAGMSIARTAVLKNFTEYVVGVTWVSVLDSSTSTACRSLSGQFFVLGSGPIPPVHYRCRSSVMPVFNQAFVRADVGAAFTAGETYYSWLKRQSVALQDSVLGETRGRLFRRGGLTAEQFAVMVLNTRYQPLTLDELRKKNPEIFARAGI